MKEALRQAGGPDGRVGRGRHRRPGQGVRPPRRVPADPQAARRRRRAGHHPRRQRRRARRGPRVVRRRGPPSRSRSSSRATRGSTTPSRSAATSFTTGPRTTTRTSSRRCGTAGSRRSSSPPTGSTSPPSTPRSARWVAGSSRHSASRPRPPTWSGSTGRRACGSPRSVPAAGRRRLGPLLRRQRRGRLPRVGQRHRPRRPGPRPVAPVLRRDRRATARPRRVDPRLQRPRRDPGRATTSWIIDAHLPDPGTPTQPVEAGYMANAWVRMKHPDYDTCADARRRRPHRPGPRRLTHRPNAVHLSARPATVPSTTAGRRRALARCRGSRGHGHRRLEERESDDGELDSVLEGRSRNLRLYGRMTDVLERDPEVATAASPPRQETLSPTSPAHCPTTAPRPRPWRATRRKGRDDGPTRPTRTASRRSRQLDDWYLDASTSLRRAGGATGRSSAANDREQHRAEVAEQLDGASVLAVAGRTRRHAAAHDAVLLGRPPAELPVVAWSAGAMAMTRLRRAVQRLRRRARPPRCGDRGVGRVERVIALPHARRRLRLEDRRAHEVFVRRFQGRLPAARRRCQGRRRPRR